MPTKVKPMLATLVREPFDNDDWLYEIKWDGYRALAGWDGQQATLYSRAGNDFSKSYPPIYEALQQLTHRALLDGEIVVLDKEGRSHFNWLQTYLKDRVRGTLAYYVFDILWCDGHNVRDWPLTRRKNLLKQVLPSDGLLRLSDHIKGQGKRFFDMTKQAGLEGMIAKRAASRYLAGRRSDQWLKVKIQQRQEVVIGGFTEPKGSRKHLGALLVGVYENKKSRYAGHVGGGIPPETMTALRQQLETLEQAKSPFSQTVKPNSKAHWVKPKLLCEVTFSEWTPDGHLRQPIFVGLRSDKPASNNITQEKPAEAPTDQPKEAERQVHFTNRHKVFWPEAGYTKDDLIGYYEKVADTMLPYIIDRPQTLLRHPNGYKGKSFFQKDAPEFTPTWVRTERIYSKDAEREIDYFIVGDVETLRYVINLGTIPLHLWSARLDSLDRPDWLVLDLDPKGAPFTDVVKVARHLHRLLDDVGLPNYVKTSGATGLHVLVPLGARYTHEEARTFARLLALLGIEAIPDLATLARPIRAREGKVYVDFGQNGHGRTIVAPFSVRPLPGAPASCPLPWEMVTARLDPGRFTIKTLPAQMEKTGDPLAPILAGSVDMATAIARIEAQLPRSH